MLEASSALNAFRKILFILLVTSFLYACGTAKTIVYEASKIDKKYNNLKVEEDKSTININKEYRDTFYNYLTTNLFNDRTINKGNDLTIKYRILQANEGNRFSRWFTGGIGNSGEATLTIEVVYLDQENKQIAKTQVEGKIGSGFFGGSFDNALEKAADDISNFTRNNFF